MDDILPLMDFSIQREKEVALTSTHQHNPDCDIWVHEYFTPSWFCLPNNQPALTVIHPGDTTRDVLEMICKVKVHFEMNLSVTVFHFQFLGFS